MNAEREKFLRLNALARAIWQEAQGASLATSVEERDRYRENANNLRKVRNRIEEEYA